MERRDFLKLTLASAGALAVNPACGSSTRRERLSSERADLFFPQSIASGDPRPNSVVLWTRIVDTQAGGPLYPLELQLALDEAFEQRVSVNGADALAFSAEAAFNGAAKVKVTGLLPATTYYYRFVYRAAGEPVATRSGRTRTAPAADADTPVRFGFVSCQRFDGRYYHAWEQLLEVEPDLDFIVHLGDYIYEYGNPASNPPAGDRWVLFDDEDAATLRSPGAETNRLGARTLAQYRRCYETYRRDPVLQRAHERYPFIITWDDHEFANDHHGATGTDQNGRTDETDIDRRKAAAQAWFENMPVDHPEGDDFRYDPSRDFPGDMQVYRELRFGRHMHLLLTESRTYRADHVVPEDAYPGAIEITQARLESLFGETSPLAIPYVEDIRAPENAGYLALLSTHAEAEGYDAARLTGPMSALWINDVLAAAAEAGGENLPEPIDEATLAALPRGIAWHQIGKSTVFSALGSRFFVIKEIFDLIAAHRFNQSDGESEVVLGAAQQRWFVDTLQGSDATWKIWGNPFTFQPLVIDLRSFGAVPEPFQRQWLIDAEHWDGMPNGRQLLLSQIGGIENLVAIAGDIHAFFAGTLRADGDPDKAIVELVGGSISSDSLKRIMVNAVNSVQSLREAGTAAIAASIDVLLREESSRPNPGMAYARTDAQGFAVVQLDGEGLDCDFHAYGNLSNELLLLPADQLPEARAALFDVTRFRVRAGQKAILRPTESGGFERWDADAFAWVDADA